MTAIQTQANFSIEGHVWKFPTPVLTRSTGYSIEVQVQIPILLYPKIQVPKTHFIGRGAAEEFLGSLFMAVPVPVTFFR